MATAKEVKARWGFCEARSPRWSSHYSSLNLPLDQPFEKLSSQQQSQLVAALKAQRPDLSDEVDRFGRYTKQFWSKEQLGRANTIYRMSPNRDRNIPFLSFIACPRFNENSDPRVQADAVPFDAPLAQSEAIIVLPVNNAPMLIEGYFRSVLFMRSPNPDDTIAVWYPD